MAATADLTTTRTNSFGRAVYWLSVAYLIIAGWLINWWIVPMYRHTPPAEINETIWAPGGPVFIAWALAIPVGAILAAVGMALYAEPRRAWLFVLVGALIVLSAMAPQSLGQYKTYVVAFGLFGGLIAVLFIAMVWFWARQRKAPEEPAKNAADLQLIGYMFFLAAAWSMCGVLGNPFHTNPGLYFPEKVLEAGSLPLMYSQGLKVSLYMVLGFAFGLLSHYNGSRAVKFGS